MTHVSISQLKKLKELRNEFNKNNPNTEFIYPDYPLLFKTNFF